MNLKEYQEKYGIKRIDFDKLKPTGLDEQYGSDKLICPYCEYEFDFESEDTDTLLGGAAFQCPDCDKWFFAEGEVEINTTTTCTPLEDALLGWTGRHVRATYKHCDECDAKGVEFNERYGCVEWETYRDYARPLFENMERENDEK